MIIAAFAAIIRKQCWNMGWVNFLSLTLDFWKRIYYPYYTVNGNQDRLRRFLANRSRTSNICRIKKYVWHEKDFCSWISNSLIIFNRCIEERRVMSYCRTPWQFWSRHCFKYPKCSEKCKSLAYFYKKSQEPTKQITSRLEHSAHVMKQCGRRCQEKIPREKSAPWGVRARVRLRLGIGLDLGSGGLFSGGIFS